MTNVLNKVIEIEDYYGNMIMVIEINDKGDIVNTIDCDVADITDDYYFDTDKELIRLQKEREEDR